MTLKHQRRLRKSLFGGLVAAVLVLGLTASSVAQTPTPVRRATATPTAAPLVCRNSTSIAVGRSVNGQITTTTPSVCYKFKGRKGDKITIAMKKTKGTTTFHPKLDLSGPGSLRMTDDPARQDAKISRTLSSDGDYTIVASSSKNQGIGSYTLTLTRQ